MKASRQDESFARSLLPRAGTAQRVVEYLAASSEQATTWPDLPPGIAAELLKYERLSIACALARVLKGDPQTITRRQTYLVRAVVTAILFPLEAFDDRLLQHIEEENGLQTLFHHIVREFATDAEHPEYVFATADACRVASFDLEDRFRRHIEEPGGAARIVEAHMEVVSALQQRVKSDMVTFGWTGVALLWIAATADLGTLPAESSTTEAFAED